MIYMTIFWIITVVGVIYYVMRGGNKNEKIKDHAMIILIAAVAFLVVAMITKDPLFSAFGVPAEFEWIVGVFIAGLTSWRLYFGPLKERLVDCEKDVASLKGEIKGVQGEIKGTKGEMSAFHREFSTIREDLHLIKKKLMV